MKRLIVLLLVLTADVFATANIGITPLYYSSKANFGNTPVAGTPIESGVLPLMKKINQVVMSKMKVQLANFSPQLTKELTEAGTFHTFNAESTIAVWRTTNPTLVSSWERESAVIPDKEATDSTKAKPDSKKKNPSKIAPSAYKANDKYILVGWVSVIKADEVRQVFPGTSKTSVLYNLNVEVQYKIIDYETRDVITQFVAAGHGGLARIVPSNINHTVNFEDISDSVVSDSISSLLLSVKHGLLIRRDMGLIPK